MAIRAALNVARWLPFALVAIIKMHYNPSTPPLPASSSSSLYPVATGSFPLEGEPLIFSSYYLSFDEPTVPSAIYSLCREELHPGFFFSPSVFQYPLLHRFTSDVSRMKEEERTFSSLFLFSI